MQHAGVRAAEWGCQPHDSDSSLGRCVEVWAPAGSVRRGDLRAIRGRADRLMAALCRILIPRNARLASRLRILVARSDVGCPVPFDLIVAPDRAKSDLALLMTRALVASRFGDNAALAETIVLGVAALAQARARIGPSVIQADRWVREQIEAGHGQSLAAMRPNRRARALAALSFVAFLSASCGRGSIRAFLASYDPQRPDEAAVSAFQQPLGALEEAWLAHHGRRTNSHDGLRSLIHRIMPLLRPFGWTRVEILVYLTVASASNVAVPIATKWYLNHFDRFFRERGILPGGGAGHHLSGMPSGDAGAFLRHTLLPFVLALLAVQIVSAVVSLRRAYVVAWLNQTVLNGLQERLFAHLQRLPHSFYSRAKTGDLMARLTTDMETIQQALSQLTNKGLYNLFTLVGGVVALFYTTGNNPSLALLTLTLVPLFATSYAVLRARNKQASREQRARVGQTAAFTQEHISAQSVVKSFGMEGRVVSAFRQRLMAQQRSKLRLALLGAFADLSEDLTTALAQLIIFGVGGYMILHDRTGHLGVGDLAAALMVVKVVFGPIASLSGIGQTAQQASGALQRVNELFEEHEEPADRPGALRLGALRHEISVEDVTFSYDGQRDVLRGLTMRIAAGSHVAIVGPSGSGKTSLVNLLMRFWDPNGGRIAFDGVDARDIALASLRGRTGIVQQETMLFDTTVRENIRIGRPGATDREVEAAAESARLHDTIESMPNGFDTLIGERGVRLSGGQRQRLAIARAILRDPQIMILDEATSALDAATEADLMQTLVELARGRTTVSITHRLSWARRADRIFVLDEGRLVEQGTHDELIAADGLYRRLYEEQARDLEAVLHDASDGPSAGGHPAPRTLSGEAA